MSQNPRTDPFDDERLADWVDGRLTREELAQFEAELRADPELASAAEEYRRTVAQIRASLATDPRHERPPVGFADSVLQAVADETAAEKGPELVVRRLRILPFLASVAAAAAVLMIYLVVQRDTSSEKPERTAAREGLVPSPDPDSSDRSVLHLATDQEKGGAGIAGAAKNQRDLADKLARARDAEVEEPQGRKRDAPSTGADDLKRFAADAPAAPAPKSAWDERAGLEPAGREQEAARGLRTDRFEKQAPAPTTAAEKDAKPEGKAEARPEAKSEAKKAPVLEELAQSEDRGTTVLFLTAAEPAQLLAKAGERRDADRGGEDRDAAKDRARDESRASSAKAKETSPPADLQQRSNLDALRTQSLLGLPLLDQAEEIPLTDVGTYTRGRLQPTAGGGLDSDMRQDRRAGYAATTSGPAELRLETGDRLFRLTGSLARRAQLVADLRKALETLPARIETRQLQLPLALRAQVPAQTEATKPAEAPADTERLGAALADVPEFLVLRRELQPGAAVPPASGPARPGAEAMPLVPEPKPESRSERKN